MSPLLRTSESLDGIQAYLDSLYRAKNIKMHPDTLWGFAAEKAGGLGRIVSKAFEKSIPEQTTDIYFVTMLSWLFAIASRNKRSIELAFSAKFPGVCPYCMEKTCKCASTNRRPLHPLSTNERNEDLKHKAIIFRYNPITFERAINTISTIYPHNRVVWSRTPEQHFAKLFEEYSELRIATRRSETLPDHGAAIDDELADIVAWTCSAWILTHPTSQSKLFDIFLEYYANGCPSCHHNPCACSSVTELYPTAIGIQNIDEIQRMLSPIAAGGSHVPISREIIGRIDRILDIARKEPSGHILKGAITEIKEILNSLSAPSSEAKAVVTYISNKLQL